MNAVHYFCIFCNVSCIWLHHAANLNLENPVVCRLSIDENNSKTITGFSVTVFHKMHQECQVLLNHMNLFRLSVNAPSHSN